MLDPARARFFLATALVALLATPASAHVGPAAVPAVGLPTIPSVAAPSGMTVAEIPLVPAAPAAVETLSRAVAAPTMDAFTFTHGRVLVTGAPAPLPAGASGSDAAAAPAPLQFRCPPTANTQFITQTVQQGTSQDRTVYGCPFRVYDAMYHFGNPQIAVNPLDEREMAFFALHGDPASNGPTPRSRANLTHTAFTTSDQGLTWLDQPTAYGGSGAGYLGESASGAMDSAGNLYAMFLWSQPGGDAESGYPGIIGLYKAATTHDGASLSQQYTTGHYIRSRGPTDIIANAYLVDVLPRVPEPPLLNYTLTANGTVPPPATQDQIGQEAAPVNRSLERVAVVWFEKAMDYRNSTTGFAGWIDAAVTKVSGRNDWARLESQRNRTKLIGPCMDASNPVAWNGLVYVVCEVDNGYAHRTRARVGDLDLWSIDPLTGNTTFVANTGLQGGHPILAVTSDGYFALLSTTKAVGRAVSHIEGAFGWYGTQWFTPQSDLGPALHHLAGDRDTFDVNVNALAITQREKTIGLVYMEWQRNRTAAAPDPSQPAQPVDPQNPVPASATPHLTDYQKFIVTINECSFPQPIAASVMQLGSGVDPQNLDAYQTSPRIFDDSQDGLVAIHEPNGEDVFTFAVNDYGAMQVGSVVAAAASIPCQLPIPPANLPPPALASALALPNPAVLITGSIVGVGAAAMVTYLLTVKRRVAHFALAEA